MLHSPNRTFFPAVKASFLADAARALTNTKFCQGCDDWAFPCWNAEGFVIIILTAIVNWEPFSAAAAPSSSLLARHATNVIFPISHTFFFFFGRVPDYQCCANGLFLLPFSK
jgi:hypothetical protein